MFERMRIFRIVKLNISLMVKSSCVEFEWMVLRIDCSEFCVVRIKAGIFRRSRDVDECVRLTKLEGLVSTVPFLSDAHAYRCLSLHSDMTTDSIPIFFQPIMCWLGDFTFSDHCLFIALGPPYLIALANMLFKNVY